MSASSDLQGGVASLPAGFTCSKRSNKRKASERFRGSRFDDGVRHGETGNDQWSMDNSNKNNNENHTHIAVTNPNFDKQQYPDPFDDNWTTSCWCWAPRKTNSGNSISGVPSAAAAAEVTSTGRREKQQRSEQYGKSRYIIRSKQNINISHHNNNNSTDINEDDHADDILECRCDHDDDDDDLTDLDNDSDDGGDNEYNNGSESDKTSRDNSCGKICSDSATTKYEKTWNKMYGRLVK